MKMKNVGPKNITRSILEDKPRKKKKRVEVELDEPVKKKKKLRDADGNVIKSKDAKKGELTKKQSKELALVGGSALTDKPMSKKLVRSYFGDHSEKIMDMLEMGDNDGGLTLLKKKLLQTVVRTLPAAEKILVESETSKGTYQFVTLVSQIRELVADLQADRDRAYIAQSLIETIIRPAFIEIANVMITKHHDFRRKSEDYVNPKKAQKYSEDLMGLAKDLAGDMNNAYKDISVKLTEALKT